MLKWVLQIVVVGLVVAVVVWLYGNYLDNTAEQNIPTDLGFLDNPANFQITGNELSANAPVRDALYQGLLNTLRISVAGIVAATILGTVVGIARLSENWIVSKLATVYVEAVRNVPLALFVVAGLLVVVLGVFPTIQEAWQFGGLAIISNRGVVVPWFIGAGLGLLAIGAVGAFVAWLVARWRATVSDRTGALPRNGLWGGGAFALVFVIGWVVLGYDWSLPELDGRQTTGGIRIDPSFFALFFALVIYTASHIAEIVRGSIQAVPKGQGEAADAVAQFPETPVVLNHTGFPWDRSVEGLKAWRENMRIIAEVPHVSVKISEHGVKDAPWDDDDNRRVIREAIEIFGFDRCMFASNLPVCRLRAGFATVVECVKSAVADATPEEREKLFSRNAAAFYRIDIG